MVYMWVCNCVENGVSFLNYSQEVTKTLFVKYVRIEKS